MSFASIRPGTEPILDWLRITAALTALCGILQTVLGLGMVGNLSGVYSFHRTLGYATLLVVVIAAVLAVLWSRRSGNKGLMFHAISVAVLALIQIGVGEMSITWLHITLGVLFLVAAAALATLAFRKPGSVRPKEASAVGGD